MHVTAGHAAQHERPTLPAKYLHVLCPACCHSLLCNSTLSKEAGLGARLIHIECQSTEKLKSWKGTTFQSGSQVGWQQCWPQRSESTPSLSQDPAQCHQHLMQQAPPPLQPAQQCAQEAQPWHFLQGFWSDSYHLFGMGRVFCFCWICG